VKNRFGSVTTMDTDPVQGEPVETQPLESSYGTSGGTIISDGSPPVTIECWSCRNTFGVPSGTPQGSILACPICQNHNRFGQTMAMMGSPNMGGVMTTAVVAMPIQSIPLGSNNMNISRAKSLLTQMRCCWCTVVVLGTLMFAGGIYYGAALTCDSIDVNGNQTCENSQAFFGQYAFLIVTGFLSAALGGWALWEIRKANIQSLQTGQDPKINYYKWFCHLGWILGTLIFVYSIVYLLYFWLLVLFAVEFFTPCICGVIMGPVVWVNCCCYQKEYNDLQLQISLNANRAQVPLQAIQTQR